MKCEKLRYCFLLRFGFGGCIPLRFSFGGCIPLRFSSFGGCIAMRIEEKGLKLIRDLLIPRFPFEERSLERGAGIFRRGVVF